MVCILFWRSAIGRFGGCFRLSLKPAAVSRRRMASSRSGSLRVVPRMLNSLMMPLPSLLTPYSRAKRSMGTSQDRLHTSHTFLALWQLGAASSRSGQLLHDTKLFTILLVISSVVVVKRTGFIAYRSYRRSSTSSQVRLDCSLFGEKFAPILPYLPILHL